LFSPKNTSLGGGGGGGVAGTVLSQYYCRSWPEKDCVLRDLTLKLLYMKHKQLVSLFSLNVVYLLPMRMQKYLNTNNLFNPLTPVFNP
jgi:hypothetical protein